MKKLIAATLVGLLSYGGMVQCHGTFFATRTYNRVIKGVSEKWIRWIMFAVSFWNFGFVCLAIDGIILNSIEFWFKNGGAIGGADYNTEGEYVQKHRVDGKTVTLRYTEFGKKMAVESYDKNGILNVIQFNRENPDSIELTQGNNTKTIKLSEHKAGQLHRLAITENGENVFNYYLDDEEYQDVMTAPAAVK